MARIKWLAVMAAAGTLLFLSLKPLGVFQEGNPIPFAVGMVKLEMGDQDMVKISGKTERYLIKASPEEQEPFLEWMKATGWSWKGQEGALLLFAKGQKKLHVTGRMYTRNYKVYEVH